MSPPRDCRSLEEYLAALEGAPAGAADEGLLRHVARCPACAEALREAQELLALEREVGRIVASEPDDSVRISQTAAARARTAGEGLSAGDDGPPDLRGVAVLRRLGSGGCADVWLARNEAGWLAVKSVREPVTPVELQAVRHYRRLADDPRMGLFPIHHVGRCERTGRLCITMPLADPLQPRTLDPEAYEPATLQAAIDRSGGLPLGEVLGIARDVLATLGSLHERGLVHRDVKPSNVLRHHGRWCLGDTGLLVREGEAPDARVGTPTYLPPDDRNDHRSADLYALGKTLHAALSGRPSRFPAPAPEHLRDRPNRGAYRRVYRAIERACNPVVGERFARARDMRRAVEGPPAFLRSFSLWTLSAVILFVAAWLLLGPWREPVRAGDAPDPGEWEVARMDPELVRQEASESLWSASHVPAGSDVCVWVGPARFEHVGLVLATYVGERRSVRVLESALQDGARVFGASANGGVWPVRLADPGPLLLLLFGRDTPWSAEEIERNVEEAMVAAGGWPAVRSEADPAAIARPVVFHGTRCTPLGTLRGGPALPPGAAPLEPVLTPLLEALRTTMPAFDGFWMEVRR